MKGISNHDFLDIEDFNYSIDDDFGPYWTIKPNSILFNILPGNITHYRFYPDMIHINDFELGDPLFGWVRNNQAVMIPSELYYSNNAEQGAFGKRRINFAPPLRLRRQAEKLGIRLVVSHNNRSIFKSPDLLRKQIKNKLKKRKRQRILRTRRTRKTLRTRRTRKTPRTRRTRKTPRYTKNTKM